MKLLDPTKIVDKSVKRDRGDINGLAQSIKKNGLLHPLVINQKGELIIGGRRLEAIKSLKMKKVLCHEVITNGRNDELRKVLAENIHRKDFSPSEKVALAKQLRPQIEAQIKRGRPNKSENFSEYKGLETREIIAEQLNTSFPTLKKAEEIVDSGNKKLITEMDKNRRVDTVYKKLNKKKNGPPTTLEQHLVQVKKKIEKLNQSLVPLLEYKDVFLSARCQNSKEGQDFVYAMAGLFGTVHVLMSKKRKEVDLIESFKLLVQSRKKKEKETK